MFGKRLASPDRFRPSVVAVTLVGLWLLLPVLSGAGQSAFGSSPPAGVSTQRGSPAAQLAADYSLPIEEAAARIARQPAVRMLRLRVQTILGAAYAGLWVDHADGGTVHMSSTKPPTETERETRAARDAFPRRDLIRIHQHPHGFDELRDLQMRFIAERRSLEAEFGVRLPQSQVIFPAALEVDAVTSDVRRIQEELTRRYSPLPVVVSSIGEEEVLVEADCHASADGCLNPLRGGLRLTGVWPDGITAQACTEGFNAYNSKGSQYVLTSGHCYPIGSIVDYRSLRIGGVPGSINQNDVDASRVFREQYSPWRADSRWIISRHQGAGFQIRETAVRHEYAGGDYICHNGFVTLLAAHCGEVTSNAADCATNYDQIRFSVGLRDGDSGASIYDDQSRGDQTGDGTNLGTAVGIINGGSAYTTCGSHIAAVQSALGVLVVTS